MHVTCMQMKAQTISPLHTPALSPKYTHAWTTAAHAHFSFITSLVCDDRDKTAVTEMSVGGWVQNWTGNYVLQLRHAEKISKAIFQCLGTGCREGGCREGAFWLCRRVRKGGKRDRTARFINVLGISVQECTMRFKIDGVIHTYRMYQRQRTG